MKINFKGVTRIVIVFKTVVVKMPKPFVWNHFLRGVLGNIEEARTWKWNSGKYERGLSHLLCPVVWVSWGGWILIMKKARTLTEDEWFVTDYSVEEHLREFAGDDSIRNYGYYQGRLVKIDYADLDDNWGEDFKPGNKKVE